MSVKVSQYELYYDAKLIEFSDGDSILEREPITYTNSINDRYHTVNIEDQLDAIAYKYWNKIVANSEFYWWVIAEVNEIENPLDISDYVGKKLLIPDILKVKLER